MFRVCIAALILGVVGCGGADKSMALPKTSLATGVVKLDGKPLPSATVTFIPQGTTKGIECIGLTDEAGKFKLQQIRGTEGAPPGEYKVVISRFLKPDGSPVGPTEAPANVQAAESLPPRYSDAQWTTLTASVPASGGDFPFELKGK